MKVRKILKHDLRFLQGTKAMSFGQGSGSLNTRHSDSQGTSPRFLQQRGEEEASRGRGTRKCGGIINSHMTWGWEDKNAKILH